MVDMQIGIRINRPMATHVRVRSIAIPSFVVAFGASLTNVFSAEPLKAETVRDWLEFYAKIERDAKKRPVGLTLRLSEINPFAIDVDRMMVEIARMPTLRRLELSGKLLTDKRLQTLLKLQNLTSLKLEENSVTRKGLGAVVAFKKLRTLHLSPWSRQHRVGSPELKFLAKLKHLRRLTLPPLTDADLSAIAGLKNLQALYIERFINVSGINDKSGPPGITDDGLKLIAQMTTLRVLSLGGNLTWRGLRRLKALKQLRSFDVAGSSVSDRGVAVLATLPAARNLESLNLDETRISNAAIREIVKLKSLEKLSLVSNQITDDAITDLLKLKGLRRLDISENRLSANGVRRLMSGLPKCRIRADCQNAPAPERSDP